MPRDLPGIRNPYVRFRPLNRPELEVASTSLWDYPSQNYGKGTQGSQLYRGATPSYVIWNVLQRFTRAGERVIDPFCGSGTTLDVCKDTGRDGRGYDIAPFRADIERADARQLPLGDATVDLAFLDPPYADNLAYSDDPDCIGKLHADDGSWRAAMGDVLREMVRVVRPGGTVAVFVCDVLQPQRGFFDLGVDVVNVGIAVGLRLVDHVAVVRRSKNSSKGAPSARPKKTTSCCAASRTCSSSSAPRVRHRAVPRPTRHRRCRVAARQQAARQRLASQRLARCARVASAPSRSGA